MIVKRTIALVLVAALVSVLLPAKTFAAGASYKVSSSYSVEADGKTTARTILEADTTTGTVPKNLSLPVSGNDIAIKDAEYQDGAKVEIKSQGGIFTISTNEAPASPKWSLVINYDVSIAAKLGKTTIYQVGPKDYGDMNIVAETLTLEAHLDLGSALERGPKPTSSSIVDGKQVLKWQNKEGKLDFAVGLVYGGNGVADFTLKTELQNNGWWWKTLSITLPPDTNQQQVFLESITPKPSSLSLDTDGNVLAEFKLRPKQKIQVEAQAKILVNNYNYPLATKNKLSEVPKEYLEQYTSASDVWAKVDANKRVTAEKTAIENIRTVFDDVVKDNTSKGADFASSKALADKLVGAMRSNAIPARVVLGQVYGDGSQLFKDAQSHAWVEVFSPGIGWITLDPVFETSGDYFGVSDVQHVGLVLRGIDPSYPPEMLDSVKLSYTDEEAPIVPEMTPTLSSTNYMILPGLALNQVNVSLPGGVIVDGSVTITNKAQIRELGSLAPLQTVTTRKLALGGAAFASTLIEYGIADANGAVSAVTAQTQTKTSYIPMIVILGVLMLLVIIKIIRKRRQKPNTSIEDDGEVIDINDGDPEIQDEILDDIAEPTTAPRDLVMHFDDDDVEVAVSTKLATDKSVIRHIAVQTKDTKGDIVVKDPTVPKKPATKRRPPRLIQ